MTAEQSMRIYLAECTLHSAVINEGIADARAWMLLTSIITINKEMLRVLE